MVYRSEQTRAPISIRVLLFLWTQHRNGGVAEDDVEDAVRADDAGLAAWALSQNNYLLNGGMHKIIGTRLISIEHTQQDAQNHSAIPFPARYCGPLLERRRWDLSTGIGEVTAALQRVQQQLKKNGPDVSGGVEADLAAVQSLLLSPAFRSALTIHTKVQQVWCSGPPHLPVHLSVQNLVSEVRLSLSNPSSSPTLTDWFVCSASMAFPVHLHPRLSNSSAF